MPDPILVCDNVYCPKCGTQVLKWTRVQWGVVPRSDYNIGDEVEWLKDKDGLILPSFKLYSVGKDGKKYYNCGDPLIKNVILFDMDFYMDFRFEKHSIICHGCAVKIVDAITIIMDGKFKEIKALLDEDVEKILGASRGKADIVVIRDDGSYWPREDWYDHPVEYVGR